MDWDDTRTLALTLEIPAGHKHYLFEAGQISPLIAYLGRETETTPELRTMQSRGSSILLFTFARDSSPKNMLVLDFQHVADVGGKWPSNSAALKPQQARLRMALELIEQHGKPVSATEFNERTRPFKDTKPILLYWKAT